MAQQTINIGAVANDGTGDTPRDAGDKINDNFTELYAADATKQPLDANLTALAGLTATTDNFIVSVASAWASRTPAQVRTTLGLTIGTNVQAYDADLTTWAGVTPGTGVTTALAANIGSAGAFVTFNGALGTPSSGTLTNATGLPISGLVASTVTAIGVGSIELGHASDTTLARSGVGDVTIEGNVIYRAGGTDVPVTDGGTGRSTSTTAYGLLAAGTTATGAHQTLATGATTEILVGGGASALPAWTTATGSGAPVRAVSPSITGTLSAAIISTSSYIATVGGLQATGARTYAGAGVGLSYTGSAGFVQSFDHGGGTWQPLTIGGSTINLGPSNVNVMVLISTLITCTVPVKHASYTVAGVPSASTAGAGAMIYVSNESGGAVPAFSDGTNWRRVTDRAVIS